MKTTKADKNMQYLDGFLQNISQRLQIWRLINDWSTIDRISGSHIRAFQNHIIVLHHPAAPHIRASSNLLPHINSLPQLDIATVWRGAAIDTRYSQAHVIKAITWHSLRRHHHHRIAMPVDGDSDSDNDSQQAPQWVRCLLLHRNTRHFLMHPRVKFPVEIIFLNFS